MHIQKKTETIFLYLSWLLFSLLAILIALSFSDYGMSTDETIRSRYGHAVVAFYRSGFTNTLAQSMGAASYYGGFFDTLCSVINTLSPLDEFATRHLLGAIIGWYGILGAYQLSTFMSGHRAGFFTALLIVITPVYYGHLFINPKDLPFATFYIWTLYYGIRCLHDIPKASLLNTVRLGIHLGLLLAVKVVGGIVSIYLLIGLLLTIYQRKNTVDWRLLLTNSLKIMLISSILAYLIMLAFWPWAWLNPWVNPFIAALEFSRFSAWQGGVMVFGQIFPYNAIPFYYLPAYFLVQLPEIFLVSLISTVVVFFYTLLTKKYKDKNSQPIYWVILSLAAFLPIILAIILKSTVYSGLRHFLFTLPAMAVFAGYGCARLFALLTTLKPPLPLLFSALLGIYLFQHINTMIALHPYQYTYFNRLTGGTAGAFQNFEMEYWSTSYKEAVSRLDQHLNTFANPKQKYPVFVYGSSIQASHYFSDKMILVNKEQDADFFIINHRYSGLLDKKLKPLITITRLNTPYSYIFENKISK